MSAPEAQWSNSRGMPPVLKRTLEHLQGGQHVFDGRTPAGPLDELVRLHWAEHLEVEHKNPRAKTYRMTDAGRYALERAQRGVDPYLRMTG